MRLSHECNTSGHDCLFLTLTYDNKHLPKDYSLKKRDAQLFNKRLRRLIERSERPKQYKYFLCGEYGPMTSRPHYHAVLIGLDMWYKDLIVKAWHLCDPLVGIMVEQIESKNALGYVAGYTSKKLGVRYNQEFRKKHKREPEFQLTSIRIGHDFIKKMAEEDPRIKDEGMWYENGKARILPRPYRRLLGIEADKYKKNIKDFQNKLVEHVVKCFPSLKVYPLKTCPADSVGSKYVFGDYIVTGKFYDKLKKLREQSDLSLKNQTEQWRKKVI